MTVALDVAQSSGDVGPLLKLVKQYAGASQTQLAVALETTQGKISKYLNSLIRVEKLEMFQRIAEGLGMPDHARISFGIAPRSRSFVGKAETQISKPRDVPGGPPTLADEPLVRRPTIPQDLSGLDQVESLRHGLNDVLSEGMMAEASLDDWERTVIRYGRATRDRPAGVLLDDLTADLAELKRTLDQRRSASALRRLTRVTAQMSGLMCLTLCKLDDRPAFRRWARTARIAANEAGDPITYAWVLAQEAYGHYYSGDLLEAVDVARHAQDLVRTLPCVGAALAAALEARAHAAMGRHQETTEALTRAEEITSHLDGDALAPSAFGYNEGQLRFHAGSAYTHLRDVKTAVVAQDRALELCTPGDYTDWAMTRLDRAACLTYSNETADALTYAAETVERLTEGQRRGIVTLRGHEILDGLSKDRQALPAARDLRELLMITTDNKGEEGP